MTFRLSCNCSSSARSAAPSPCVPVSVLMRFCRVCKAEESLSVISRSSDTISIRESISRIPVLLNLSSTRCKPACTSMSACCTSGSLTTAIRLLTLCSSASACLRTTSTASPTSELRVPMTVLDTVLPKFLNCLSYSARPALILASASSNCVCATSS